MSSTGRKRDAAMPGASSHDEGGVRAIKCRHDSLASICREVVEKNLERYPPCAFAILDEYEWEEIIQLRHKKTRPQKGSGGIDGTGRMTAAVGYKFLSQVEESIPHLAESAIVDEIVWKDCVEQKFKAGGMGRPKALMYPWPVLVARLQNSGKTLLHLVKKDETEANQGDLKLVLQEIQKLSETPMNVSLLKASGIGKTIKKFLKLAASPGSCIDLNQYIDTPNTGRSKKTIRKRLTSILESWMSIAAESGVKMKEAGGSPALHHASKDNDQKDLTACEKCQSWRLLFATLDEYDEKRRSNQGARMRERRKKLDSVRPKIVKVSPSNSRHEAILCRQDPRMAGSRGRAPSSGNSKIQQLRMEAVVTSARRQPPAQMKRSNASKQVPRAAGFGAAVAFAAGSRGGTKRKATTTMVSLGAGKRLKIPDAKRAGSELKKKLGLDKRGPYRR